MANAITRKAINTPSTTGMAPEIHMQAALALPGQTLWAVLPVDDVCPSRPPRSGVETRTSLSLSLSLPPSLPLSPSTSLSLGISLPLEAFSLLLYMVWRLSLGLWGSFGQWVVVLSGDGLGVLGFRGPKLPEPNPKILKRETLRFRLWAARYLF